MRLKVHFFALSLLLLLSRQVAASDSFEIDRKHSNVQFSIRHIISTVHGRFSKFGGTISLDSSDIGKFTIELIVQDSSINTDHEGRDRHLRSKDFFSVDSFPTSTFKSVRSYEKDKQFFVEGDFTMRGITKRITVPFELLGVVGKGDEAVLGLHSTFKIDRTDYGILWNNLLDSGGTLLGNEVTINIEIEARKPRPPRQ
jgi:polyisoprenoid-binding protein YceI